MHTYCPHAAKKEMVGAIALAIIVSSISVFILTSFTFLLFGYICGWRQRCKTPSRSGEQTIENSPVYESVVPTITTEQADLKLEKNEAYDQLPWDCHGHNNV